MSEGSTLRNRAPSLLLAVIGLSIILRIGVAFYLGDIVDAPPLLTDQRSYHALGVRLLQGHGYSFDRAWYPFTPANAPTAHWSFLYPLFVAGVYAVSGVHPLAVRLLQAGLGGFLLPWMVYRLVRRIVLVSSSEGPAPSALGSAGRELATVAAALGALYPYYILYAATLMTETFYIAALLWSLEVGLRVGSRLRQRQRVRWVLAVELGLSLAVATLLRQSFLPWVPVFFLWFLWLSHGRVRLGPVLAPLALAGTVLLLAIVPWTLRNYRVYGQFLLLNSNAGYAMYSAQHPLQGTRFSEFWAAPVPENLPGINEAQWDRALLRIGLGFVRDDPLRYLRLCLSRVRAFLEFWPTSGTTLLHNLGRMASLGVFGPFMVYGLYLAARRPAAPGSAARAVSSAPGMVGWAMGLLCLFVACYSLLHILTWAMVRYRLPADAVGLVFAALALQDLYQRARRWSEARRLS
jgi:hypothetical protein